jgi:Immunity protein 63
MKTLAEIQTTVTALAQRIGASTALLPAYGSAVDDGSPFVEVDASQYHYVVEERGQEISRQSSSDINDLLYWIFADVTHSMGFAYELAHRVPAMQPKPDSRRAGFAEQLALLRRIAPTMAERRASEIEAILRNAPYVDGRTT